MVGAGVGLGGSVVVGSWVEGSAVEVVVGGITPVPASFKVPSVVLAAGSFGSGVDCVLSDIGCFLHEDVLIGSVGGDFGEDTKAYVALAEREVIFVGFEGWGADQDLATGEEFVKPPPALGGVHCGGEEFDSGALVLGLALFGFANVFAVGGVVGHWAGAPPPPCCPSMACNALPPPGLIWA